MKQRKIALVGAESSCLTFGEEDYLAGKHHFADFTVKLALLRRVHCLIKGLNESWVVTLFNVCQ